MQMATSENTGLLARFLPMMNQGGIDALTRPDPTSAPSHHILIMESSPSLAKLLATGLASESVSVDVTHDMAETAFQLESRAYNLLILDLDPPDAQGIALLRDLRARRPEVRVLVLSGRGGIEDRVAALDLGADDYLLKPFSLLEMMARVRALRRRSNVTPAPREPKAGKLTVYADQCRVERDGRPVDLTPREFSLLEFMMKNPGKTLTRSTLSQAVWNMPSEANTNIVDVYIKYLRDKLDEGHDEKLIRTVRGMGYVFQMQS